MISLGPFDLEHPIGHGGMGEVWWAVHRRQKLSVAVKLLTTDAARDPNFRSAFRNEVRAVAGLDHPHIVRVFDYGEVDAAAAKASEGRLIETTPYLAMELVADGTLSQMRGRITWTELREVIRGLLDALAHAHARGVVHRDIKPGNVLLGREQLDENRSRVQVKLTDFGLAHALGEDAQLDDSDLRHMSGTPAYMAPEQFRGEWRNYGPWTDIYAMGCLVWVLVTGKPLFGKLKNISQRAMAHLTKPIPQLEARMVLPDGFEAWLRAMLAKDPRHRYQRAADAAWGLMQLDDSSIPDTRADVHSLMDTELLPTLIGDAFHAAVTGWADTEQTTRIFNALDLPPEEHTDAGVRVFRPASPPVPPSWRHRTPPRPDMKLVGAGLGLYGLRAVPLVGREDERNAMWSALRRVEQSKSAEFIVLRGPSGCGKSRLARWVAERAHEVGAATVLKASHSAIQGSSSGLGAMISRHYSCMGMKRAKRLERLEKMLTAEGVTDPDEWYALAEWMAPATEADVTAGVRLIRFASPAERYVVLLRMMRRLSHDRPVVLWLDDVQWGLDALQLAVWLLAEQRSLPLLVVMTAMDEALSQAPVERTLFDSVVDSKAVSTLEIGPLPQEHRPILIQQLLGLEGKLARQVEARTAGNPLFAVQLVGDWVERGLLEPGANGFTLKAGVSLSLPDDMHQVWAHRIEAVLKGRSRKEEKALELAAVLGGIVNTEEWAEVCDRAGADASAQLLDALLTHHLADPHEDGWGFVHGMVRESVERRARDRGRLATLHRLCANLLEERPGPRTDERLGRHLLAAGDEESAMAPLLRGAQQRILGGDFSLAESLLASRELAMTQLAVPDADERWSVGWLLRYKIAARRVRYDEANAWLVKTSTAADKYDWTAVSAAVATYAGHMARLKGEPKRSADLLLACTRQVEALGDRKLLAQHHVDLAESLAEIGELGEAKRYTELARKDFEVIGDQVGIAFCWKNLGEIVKVEGAHAKAAKLMWTAMAIYEEIGNRWGQAGTLNSLGDISRYMGKHKEAEQLYGQAGELFRAIGSGSAVYPEYNMALALLERGRHPEAKQVFERVLGIFQQQGRQTATADCHLGLAGCAAPGREWKLWDHHTALCLQLNEGTGSADEDTARLAEVVGDITAASGDPQRARAVYTLALEHWRALGRDDEAISVLGLLAGLS